MSDLSSNEIHSYITPIKKMRKKQEFASPNPYVKDLNPNVLCGCKSWLHPSAKPFSRKGFSFSSSYVTFNPFADIFVPRVNQIFSHLSFKSSGVTESSLELSVVQKMN